MNVDRKKFFEEKDKFTDFIPFGNGFMPKDRLIKIESGAVTEWFLGDKIKFRLTTIPQSYDATYEVFK
jgi:hypothetical protein